MNLFDPKITSTPAYIDHAIKSKPSKSFEKHESDGESRIASSELILSMDMAIMNNLNGKCRNKIIQCGNSIKENNERINRTIIELC